jgi:hypothetical protein
MKGLLANLFPSGLGATTGLLAIGSSFLPKGFEKLTFLEVS